MVWILVVLFVDRGILVDRPSVFIDSKNYSTQAECVARSEELRVAYQSTYVSATCRRV